MIPLKLQASQKKFAMAKKNQRKSISIPIYLYICSLRYPFFVLRSSFSVRLPFEKLARKLKEIDEAKTRKDKEAVLIDLLYEAMKCSVEDLIFVIHAFTSDLPLDQYKHYIRGANYLEIVSAQSIANALSTLATKRTTKDVVLEKNEKFGEMSKTAAFFKNRNPVRRLFPDKEGMSVGAFMAKLRQSTDMARRNNSTGRNKVLTEVLHQCHTSDSWQFAVKIFEGKCQSMGFGTNQILKCLAKHTPSPRKCRASSYSTTSKCCTDSEAHWSMW